MVMMSVISFAQQEYSFSHYADANSFINPAATATENQQKLTGIFRKQWVNFNGSPMTGGISYEHPLSSYNMGLGGYIFSDQIGATNMTNVVVNYSYSLKLDNKHKLAMGMDLGADFVSTNYDRLVYWDETDAMFNSGRESNVVPRAGVGFHFYADDYYVGISVPRVLTFNDKHSLTIKKENLPSLVSHYYLTGGYKFPVNEDITMRTTALMKYTPNVKPQADVNVMGIYREMIGLGLGYKSLGFASVNVLYMYKQSFSIGYAFDMTLTSIRNYSQGSHELMLKYIIPNKPESQERFK